MAVFLLRANCPAISFITINNWLNGLPDYPAVSAIYGLMFGLLRPLAGWSRPPWRLPHLLWGVVYGMVLNGFAQGVLAPFLASALTQKGVWQLAAAYLLHGLVLADR